MTSLDHHTPRRHSPRHEKDALKRPVKARPSHRVKVAGRVTDFSNISISLDRLCVTSPFKDNITTTVLMDSKQEAPKSFPFVLQPPAFCGQHGSGSPINEQLGDNSDPLPIRLKPRFTDRFLQESYPYEHAPFSLQHGHSSSALLASDELIFPGLSEECIVKNGKISLRPRPSGTKNVRQASLSISPKSTIAIDSTGIHSQDEPSLITPPSTPPRSQRELHMPMSPPACLRKEPNFDDEDSLDDIQKLLLPHLK